jgi:hypothetical protein
MKWLFLFRAIRPTPIRNSSGDAAALFLPAEKQVLPWALTLPGAAMFGITLRAAQMASGITGVAAMAAGGLVYWLTRKRPSPDELERDRRDGLVQKGRIIDATVLDISEVSAEESDRPLGMQLILYQYDVAGVTYECSQDVTLLQHVVDIHKIRLSFPASVRYDPHNPGNSLIVAENWSGLRDTANSIPLHPLRRANVRQAIV